MQTPLLRNVDAQVISASKVTRRKVSIPERSDHFQYDPPHDNVDLLPGRTQIHHWAEKINELMAGMPSGGFAMQLARLYLQRRVQR